MKVGILGGGQLARMLTQAGLPLGIKTLCYDPSPEACAKEVTPMINASYDDWDALEKFASAVDVVTFETENIPLNTAEFVASRKRLAPNTLSLKMSQDRFFEKNLFNTLAIPTTQFQAIDDPNILSELAFSYPCVMKTRRFGYDGKGQAVLKSAADFNKYKSQFSKTPYIVEEFIPFEREVSLIAVRSHQGEIRYYPLTENKHHSGILRLSKAPYFDAALQKKAESYLELLLNHLNYCGVLAVEFFQCGSKLIANEMAPRVHNTGHWTIEGAETSQFENHMRAITHLPLGSTAAKGKAIMYNIIGEEPNRETYSNVPDLHYHSYGKSARPNRKLGHITMTDQSSSERFHTWSKHFSSNLTG